MANFEIGQGVVSPQVVRILDGEAFLAIPALGPVNHRPRLGVSNLGGQATGQPLVQKELESVVIALAPAAVEEALLRVRRMGLDGARAGLQAVVY